MAPRPAARDIRVVELLDRYSSGHFAEVVDQLNGDVDDGALLKELRRVGPPWIDAAGPAGRARRTLAAATFALEAARAGEWREWKLIQMQPEMGDGVQPLNVLYWKAPPLLIEWGCALMRARPEPTPIERWWQLAALAVAQRSEDSQFLVGDLAIGKGIAAGEIGNRQDEIKHLEHLRKRFPDEKRFLPRRGHRPRRRLGRRRDPGVSRARGRSGRRRRSDDALRCDADAP